MSRSVFAATRDQHTRTEMTPVMSVTAIASEKKRGDKMKIYLATRFANKEVMKEKRTWLEGLGYEITSRWLDGDPASQTDNALMDVADVDRADVLVLFPDVVPQPPRPYGGAFFEFGYAYAHRKRCLIVYPETTTSIFIHLPGVWHVKSWEQLPQTLQTIQAFDLALPGAIVKPA